LYAADIRVKLFYRLDLRVKYMFFKVIVGFGGVADVKSLDSLVNMSVRKAKKFDSFYSEYIVGTQNLTLWKSYGLSNLYVFHFLYSSCEQKKTVQKYCRHRQQRDLTL